LNATRSAALAELTALLGDEVVKAPDADALARHTRDYGVQGSVDVGVLALVYPRTTAEVSALLRYCHEHRVAVQPQGGMTGLSGGGVPAGPCVILAMERMRVIRELDTAAATITVEAGVVLERIQQAAAAADFFFPLDLGARGSCQIGGNLSTNAGGNRVLRFGMARELTLGVEAVLADGTVIDALGKVTKNNTGYDLRQLFIGSEGTLGVITAAVLRLFPRARSLCTGMFALDSYADVLTLLNRVRTSFGPQLTAFEVMWPAFYLLGTTRLGRRPPVALAEGIGVLVETMGFDTVSDPERFEQVLGAALQDGLIVDAAIAQSERETSELWAVRDSPAEWRQAGHWPQLSFDVSVPTGEIGKLVAEIDTALSRHWRDLQVLYFGHVADGNLHVSVNMAADPAPQHEIEAVVYEVVAQRRGSISAEHGIGSLKVPFLELSRSAAEVALMRAIKKTLDPRNILNPGKIF